MLLALLSLLSLPPLGACSSAGYVIRQASGQWAVLRGRERIDALLRRPDLPGQRRYKLRLAGIARRYAHEVVGLRLTGAYSYFYDTGGRPVAYNLSAAPKDALRPKTWRFPIVGAVPYLGFFDKAEARRAQRALQQQGLDTLLRPVPAYSSLGWFNDPIYSPLVDGDPWRLVEVVIHEMTHTTVFLRGEVAFNESLAVFVGQQATLDLLARLWGPGTPQVAQLARKIERRRRLARLIEQLYRRLERLYDRPLGLALKLRRREQLFRAAQQRYKQIFGDPRNWGSFVRRPLNNAVLLSYGRYHEGLTFHRRVYRALGRDLARLVRLYQQAQWFPDPVGYVARHCRISRGRAQRM